MSSLLKAATSEIALPDIQRLEGVTEGLLYEINREYEQAPNLTPSRSRRAQHDNVDVDVS